MSLAWRASLLTATGVGLLATPMAGALWFGWFQAPIASALVWLAHCALAVCRCDLPQLVEGFETVGGHEP